MELLSYEPEVEVGIYETGNATIPEYRPYRVIEERENENILRGPIPLTEALPYFQKQVGDDGSSQVKRVQQHRKLLYRRYVDRVRQNTGKGKGKLHKEEEREESAKRRLERIEFEVKELERELEDQADPTPASTTPTEPTPSDLLTKLTDFQQRVAQLTLKLPGSQAPTASTEGDCLMKKLNSLFLSNQLPNIPANLKPLPYQEQVSQALELEARIASLEALLGPETLVKADLPQEPNLPTLLTKMTTMVEKIRRPDHLFTINKRLKEFISELDKVTSNRDSLKLLGKDLVYLDEHGELDTETKTKIDRMLTLYHQFELYLALGPQFATRLKQLTVMHQELHGYDDTLTNLTTTLHETQSLTQKGDEKYQELLTTFQTHQTTVDSQLSSIDTRITKLLREIEALH